MADKPKAKPKRPDISKRGSAAKLAPWYSDHEIALLLASIRTGASIEISCGKAKIGKSTFFARLAAKSPEALELSERIDQARADGAVVLLQIIGDAAKAGNWQAAAKKLEWMYPETYGRNRFEITGKDGGAVQVAATVAVDLSRLTDEELHIARELHAKMQGE